MGPVSMNEILYEGFYTGSTSGVTHSSLARNKMAVKNLGYMTTLGFSINGSIGK